MDSKIGSLTPGKRADVILIRTDNFGMTPLNNPIGAVVYNAHPGLVDTVLVDGEVVKRDGTLRGRRRGARAAPRGRVTRRHPAARERRKRRPAGRRLDSEAVRGGRGLTAAAERRCPACSCPLDTVGSIA